MVCENLVAGFESILEIEENARYQVANLQKGFPIVPSSPPASSRTAS